MARDKTRRELDKVQRVARAEAAGGKRDAYDAFQRAMVKVPADTKKWAEAFRDQLLAEGDGELTASEYRMVKTAGGMAAWTDLLSEACTIALKLDGLDKVETVAKITSNIARLSEVTRSHVESALESVRARRAAKDKPADPLEAYLVAKVDEG